jgi:cytochrome c oxidase subunit II
MAISPPESRVWWNDPVSPAELIWIAIAFLWGVIMFFMMVYWHLEGEQNVSTEVYRIDPAVYQERVDDFADTFQVGEESGIPVVRPAPGGDAYMVARLWEFWPILELQKARPIGCICRRSTGSTAFRCSRSTSTCRSTPG